MKKRIASLDRIKQLLGIATEPVTIPRQYTAGLENDGYILGRPSLEAIAKAAEQDRIARERTEAILADADRSIAQAQETAEQNQKEQDMKTRDDG